MQNNIVVRAVLSVVVALLFIFVLMPRIGVPDPFNWLLGLVIVLGLFYWTVKGNDLF